MWKLECLKLKTFKKDKDMSKNNLKTRFAEVKQQVLDIYKAAKNENRGLSEDESAKVEILKREMGEINADMMIEASERAAARVAGVTGSETRANEVRSLFANSVRDAIKNGGTAPIPSSQILYNQAIIDGIGKSARLGKEIEIEIPEI